MPTLETAVIINAPAQLVWSVLDDLERYPEWNEVIPDLQGHTTVGKRVSGTLRQDNTPDIPINPTLTRIVGARELRWLSEAPGGVFCAEHIFVLEPTEDGKTRFQHNEVFCGPVADERWPNIDRNTRAAYEKFNRLLKARAEELARGVLLLHPAAGKAANSNGACSLLRCYCQQDPVEVTVSAPIYHTHLCGCSKCWKPEGSLFAQIAMTSAGSVTETQNAYKLAVVDTTQKIERYACKACGTHMVGRVTDKDHHFYGLEFIHPELADSGAQPPIEFAAFTSSLVESGTSPSSMYAIRRQFRELAIPVYDAFSPELMDVIAWHRVKLAKAGPAINASKN
ncbi:SRPBCC family protein [Agrobacterium tumefaciens]|uniref:Glutathione-dependent formaldehyde-activating protein n=1 Tax=Agrobacterium tumefaciens TaxID=358 RepID=A0AA44F5Q0_AGRTU|nr:SRPBCC family protein [Agrobacterium tumefaciens]NSL21214.1 glutathione-dependent formaldehyde-activating protein [Agrobacterium tumefaciens]NTB83786.1 glutathione-dependent formaldehyde-activating protein [Agrobacterium tumefaciens]NTC20745.1 glutathione-dependent formaldehyde-activating protein [Agrobacterium tumefaciens]NTC29257.1 glutathione-dependent formaldehyde-activating protein [Agrobacterium tumefaciens]NTC57537.1 glutathione-dependent formaldehyde-activating protein [Agrobacteriu